MSTSKDNIQSRVVRAQLGLRLILTRANKNQPKKETGTAQK